MRALVRVGFIVATLCVWIGQLGAQSSEDVVWVQIEAHPNLSTAQERAEIYARQIEDVNGFALPGGWFGIAVGPYRRSDANQVLRVYRADRLIPSDSYIAFSSVYGQQFFPRGADVLNRGALDAPTTTPQDEATETAQVEITEPDPEPADETPAEARRNEQLMTRDERENLQIALKWAGYYNATIDGAFGRGTRSSMAAWQDDNGFEVTGILTTRQRAALFTQYNAVLEGLGLASVQDVQAGIEMQIPTDIVAADGYDYPFAKYSATGGLNAQVLLISQQGGPATLTGLYNIMQTLEIVPLDGKREQRGNSFLLIGENDDIVSHTEAELSNGEIKGFTLVWPAGDEERRTRVLEEMRASFVRLDGVLDPSWTDDDGQAIDLVAGLQIRKPRLSRSGFFVTDDGAVVTTVEAVQSCTRVTLDEDTDATIAVTDDGLGLAVLTPATRLTPRAVAQFASSAPRLQSDAVASGFSYEGVLGAPTVTFGTVSDLRGLGGEDDLTRLEIDMLGGDAGGPVFNEAGAVLGVLLPRSGSARQLPSDVNFALKAATVQALLSQSGISSTSSVSQAPMAPEDISDQARDVTVLVSCWD